MRDFRQLISFELDESTAGSLSSCTTARLLRSAIDESTCVKNCAHVRCKIASGDKIKDFSVQIMIGSEKNRLHMGVWDYEKLSQRTNPILHRKVRFMVRLLLRFIYQKLDLSCA